MTDTKLITDERIAELEADAAVGLLLGKMFARAGEWPTLLARLRKAEAERNAAASALESALEQLERLQIQCRPQGQRRPQGDQP